MLIRWFNRTFRQQGYIDAMMETIIAYDSGKATPPVQRTRLTPPVYNSLVQAVAYPLHAPKDQLDAAFQCGVQHVLQKLREGFVE